MFPFLILLNVGNLTVFPIFVSEKNEIPFGSKRKENFTSDFVCNLRLVLEPKEIQFCSKQME